MNKNSRSGVTAQPPHGQGRAEGRVLYNGKGAANIEVSLCEKVVSMGSCNGMTYKTKTDKNGSYTLNKVRAGDYALAVRVFNSDAYIYPTPRGLYTARYQIEAGKTLKVQAVNLSKNDLRILAPENGAMLESATPKLSWSAYPGTKTYQVTLRPKGVTLEASTFKTALTSVILKEPLLNGVYEWKVEAINAEGVKLADTPKVASFKVVDQPGSAAVQLVAPVANGTVGSANLKLVWKAHPTATGYQIYLSAVSATLPELAYQEVRGTQYALTKALTPGKYFWTVIATRNGKKVAASTLQTFTVK